jgi:23S rRNA (cytosine1962-C5)-methyltransferase
MPENDVVPAALSGATVFIKPKRARPFFGRHPWVLDSAILRVDGNPDSGAVVDVVTHDGNFIARGLWNASSRIRVRLYSFMQDQARDQIFWNARIENAVALRQQLHLFSKKTGCRLINSEGDNLSGVIVDQYGPYLAVQVTALVMAERLDMICDSLERIVQPKGILLRGAERGLGKLEGLHLPDRLLRGEPPDGPIFVEEHGLRFGVDLTEGQKTRIARIQTLYRS